MPGMDLHHLASSEREALRPHLRIKSFFGTSTNAVKTQIWIAVSIYLRVVKGSVLHESNPQDHYVGSLYEGCGSLSPL